MTRKSATARAETANASTATGDHDAGGPTSRRPRRRPGVEQHQNPATGNDDEPAQAVDGHPGQYGSDQVQRVVSLRA